MSRAYLRTLFAAAAVTSATVLLAAGVATLRPASIATSEPESVAIANVATLREREPQILVVPELKGLDLEARRLRVRGGYQLMGARTPRAGDLGVVVVKSEGTVRAFIALDPRNGCALKIETLAVPLAEGGVAFHDVCHGSLYDLMGQRVGGPTPWDLDELVVTVRGNVVYADRHKVTPGRLVLR